MWCYPFKNSSLIAPTIRMSGKALPIAVRPWSVQGPRKTRKNKKQSASKRSSSANSFRTASPTFHNVEMFTPSVVSSAERNERQVPTPSPPNLPNRPSAPKGRGFPGTSTRHKPTKAPPTSPETPSPPNLPSRPSGPKGRGFPGTTLRHKPTKAPPPSPKMLTPPPTPSPPNLPSRPAAPKGRTRKTKASFFFLVPTVSQTLEDLASEFKKEAEASSTPKSHADDIQLAKIRVNTYINTVRDALVISANALLKKAACIRKIVMEGLNTVNQNFMPATKGPVFDIAATTVIPVQQTGNNVNDFMVNISYTDFATGWIKSQPEIPLLIDTAKADAFLRCQ